jgi:hypothetical protein
MLDADCPFAVEMLAALAAGGATIDYAQALASQVPACSCTHFKHYCMCDHALAILEADKVVVSPPPTLDPTPTVRAAKQPRVTPRPLSARAPSKGGGGSQGTQGGGARQPREAEAEAEAQSLKLMGSTREINNFANN